MIEVLAGWGLVALFGVSVMALCVATMDRNDD